MAIEHITDEGKKLRNEYLRKWREQMTEEQKEQRRAYQREYFRSHKEEYKQYRANYWNRKAGGANNG